MSSETLIKCWNVKIIFQKYLVVIIKPKLPWSTTTTEGRFHVCLLAKQMFHRNDNHNTHFKHHHSLDINLVSIQLGSRYCRMCFCTILESFIYIQNIKLVLDHKRCVWSLTTGVRYTMTMMRRRKLPDPAAPAKNDRSAYHM